MPVILNPEEMNSIEQVEGVKITTLADRHAIGSPAMVARRWSIAPGVYSTQQKHGPTEQLLYVISGNGHAIVNGERLPLEPETVLWLEPGDVYQFYSGVRRLEILQGYAPGE
jgi:quercetin dioxygenase-like cupin family protein